MREPLDDVWEADNVGALREEFKEEIGMGSLLEERGSLWARRDDADILIGD